MLQLLTGQANTHTLMNFDYRQRKFAILVFPLLTLKPKLVLNKSNNILSSSEHRTTQYTDMRYLFETQEKLILERDMCFFNLS